jgi:predicted dehydrogenase
MVAAASRDLNRARSMGAPRSYGSYEQLLDDPEVDAVYIGTHNGLHKKLTIQALRCGKHVLCEKPLANSASECEEILRVAEHENRLVVEAFMYRYHPQIQVVFSLLRAGEIGDLRAIEASFRFHLTAPDDVRLRPDWGGGSLLDVGSYCVNASRLFLGDNPSNVHAVATIAKPSGVDTSFHGVLEYANGTHSTISCGFDGGLHQKLVIIGTQGTIALDEPFIAWTGAPTLRILRGREEEVARMPSVDTFVLEIEDLADAILTGASPLLRPEEGLRNARVLDRLAEDAGLPSFRGRHRRLTPIVGPVMPLSLRAGARGE